MVVQPPITEMECGFCHNKFKNLQQHHRHCKLNPKNMPKPVVIEHCDKCGWSGKSINSHRRTCLGIETEETEETEIVPNETEIPKAVEVPKSEPQKEEVKKEVEIVVETLVEKKVNSDMPISKPETKSEQTWAEKVAAAEKVLEENKKLQLELERERQKQEESRRLVEQELLKERAILDAKKLEEAYLLVSADLEQKKQKRANLEAQIKITPEIQQIKIPPEITAAAIKRESEVKVDILQPLPSNDKEYKILPPVENKPTYVCPDCYLLCEDLKKHECPKRKEDAKEFTLDRIMSEVKREIKDNPKPAEPVVKPVEETGRRIMINSTRDVVIPFNWLSLAAWKEQWRSLDKETAVLRFFYMVVITSVLTLIILYLEG